MAHIGMKNPVQQSGQKETSTQKVSLLRKQSTLLEHRIKTKLSFLQMME